MLWCDECWLFHEDRTLFLHQHYPNAKPCRIHQQVSFGSRQHSCRTHEKLKDPSHPFYTGHIAIFDGYGVMRRTLRVIHERTFIVYPIFIDHFCNC